MAGVMIGVDPHKASRTAVAISGAEEPLGELRVRANAVQAERLLAWACGLAAHGPRRAGRSGRLTACMARSLLPRIAWRRPWEAVIG